jgi:hypothetical protein
LAARTPRCAEGGAAERKTRAYYCGLSPSHRATVIVVTFGTLAIDRNPRLSCGDGQTSENALTFLPWVQVAVAIDGTVKPRGAAGARADKRK